MGHKTAEGNMKVERVISECECIEKGGVLLQFETKWRHQHPYQAKAT